MLLVEDIVATIPPIREAFLVAAGAQYGSLLIVCFLEFLLLWAHLKVLICVSTRRSQIHLMWVDNLRFLLEVECLALFWDNSLFVFPLEVFLIATQ